MSKPKAHVSEAKKKEVVAITSLLEKSSVVGLIDLTNLPSPQFQKIKHKLKDKLKVVVTKKSIIKRALEKADEKKKGLKEFEGMLENCMPALLLSEEDPFKISKSLDKNKSNAPAKVGQITPRAIVIPAGPTAFAAGPIIGELGKAGIKATIEGGKVVIQEDKLLLSPGDEIDQGAADLLSKFKIEPIEIGLNVMGIYKDGEIFEREVLTVDEGEYRKQITQAAHEAINLAVFSTYPSKDVIELLLRKAESDSLALESSQKLLEKIESGSPKEEAPKEKPKVEEKATEEVSKEEPQKEDNSQSENQEAPEEAPKEVTDNSPESSESGSKDEGQGEYSEEDSKKAQEIINEMKDKEISGGN